MAETIFSKIIAGQIPCHKVYEDGKVFAFLDIGPVSRGHTLVVPKEPAPTLDELSEDSAGALGRALPAICRAVVKATGASAYNVLQNNGALAHQAVMHVHFHVIPRYEAGAAGGRSGAGLGIKWNAGKLDPAEGAALAKEIASHVGAR